MNDKKNFISARSHTTIQNESTEWYTTHQKYTLRQFTLSFLVHLFQNIKLI